MIRRRPLSEAPAALKDLFEELQKSGDYLVFENEQHEPVISITPLQEQAKARRARAAQKLRTIVARTPPSPYSEEETLARINETIAATKGEYLKDEAARRLRKLLDELPDVPYSEEEVVRNINEAIAAIRREEAAPRE